MTRNVVYFVRKIIGESIVLDDTEAALSSHFWNFENLVVVMYTSRIYVSSWIMDTYEIQESANGQILSFS